MPEISNLRPVGSNLDVSSYEIKHNDIKPSEVKSREVRSSEMKSDEKRPDEIRTDGIKPGDRVGGPLRRRPMQQRSAKRVAQMLDASAELIEEIGYESITTTLIAKRAGVAVGSLYQFFPDKRAVVQALTQRNFERFLAAVDEELRNVEHEHWWDLVDTLLDIYLRMHREIPGFSKMHFGDVVDLRLVNGSHSNNAVVAQALSELLAGKLHFSIEELTLPITIAVEAADVLLNLAFRKSPQGNPEILAETKHLIKGYLASRLGE